MFSMLGVKFHGFKMAVTLPVAKCNQLIPLMMGDLTVSQKLCFSSVD